MRRTFLRVAAILAMLLVGVMVVGVVYIEVRSVGAKNHIRLDNDLGATIELQCPQRYGLRAGDRQTIALDGATNSDTVCDFTQRGVPYRQYELCLDDGLFRINQVVAASKIIEFTCP